MSHGSFFFRYSAGWHLPLIPLACNEQSEHPHHNQPRTEFRAILPRSVIRAYGGIALRP